MTQEQRDLVRSRLQTLRDDCARMSYAIASMNEGAMWDVMDIGNWEAMAETCDAIAFTLGMGLADTTPED